MDQGKEKVCNSYLENKYFFLASVKGEKNYQPSKNEFQPQNTGSSYVRLEMSKMRAVFICRKISQLAVSLRLSSFTSREI